MSLRNLISKISSKNLEVSINLERPIFVQPEDRILYRSHRVLVVISALNLKYGMSKDVIACVDFILRNQSLIPMFVSEYFTGKTNLVHKINMLSEIHSPELDFNIVQYRSVPWDLRFNDMYLYLHIRGLVRFKIEKEKRQSARVFLSESGLSYAEKIKPIFPDEMAFLNLFDGKISEEKILKIITEIIPNTYWKENAQSNY